MHGPFDPSPLPALAEASAVLSGGDPVHAQETELPKKALMMSSPKGRVVDDAKGAGDLRGEATKAVHGNLGFTARVGHTLGVQDDPPLTRAGSHDDELRPPGGLPIPLEVQARVGFATHLTGLPARLVGARLPHLALEQGREHLPVGVKHP